VGAPKIGKIKKGGEKVTTKLPWATAAIIIVAAVAGLAYWQLGAEPEIVPADRGTTWGGTIVGEDQPAVVYAAAEPAYSGLENVYIVDNRHTAGWAINFSGNDNVLGVITGSGGTANIPYDNKYVIVVAAKAHDLQLAYVVRENIRVQLISSKLGISENKTGAGLNVFVNAAPTYLRVNAVWDNYVAAVGAGFAGIPAGGSVALDNIALSCWS
jgi:hypothetical protein